MAGTLAFDLRFVGVGHLVGMLCRLRRGGTLPAFPGDDVPDEFSYMEGAQTDVLGPASLAVVAAGGVHPLPGPEFPEALSQVLLVDSTLALCAHARRIVNPEEYDGYLFLDESGGPVSSLASLVLHDLLSAARFALSKDSAGGRFCGVRGKGGGGTSACPAPQITQSW